jgi:hypothetical protein
MQVAALESELLSKMSIITELSTHLSEVMPQAAACHALQTQLSRMESDKAVLMKQLERVSANLAGLEDRMVAHMEVSSVYRQAADHSCT